VEGVCPYLGGFQIRIHAGVPFKNLLREDILLLNKQLAPFQQRVLLRASDGYLPLND
jgi:hypothetical protein